MAWCVEAGGVRRVRDVSVTVWQAWHRKVRYGWARFGWHGEAGTARTARLV